MEYKFRCNFDPNGRVVYDIVFEPDDGGDIKHEPQPVIATNGKTEVGLPDEYPIVPDHPLVLDPLQHNGKASGKYKVIPIDLQPADWDWDPLGNPVINANLVQTGVTGAMVPSIKGPQGDLHYVSPKAQAGGVGTVVIRAGLPPGIKFEDYYVWQVTKADGTVVTSYPDGAKVGVPRSQPAQYLVKVMTKPQAPHGPVPVPVPKEITHLNLWVVWANGTFKHTPPVDGYNYVAENVPLFGGDHANERCFDSKPPNGTYNDAYALQFEIQPKEIVDVSQDIPDLRGVSTVKVPPPNKTHLLEITELLSEAAEYKWDVTQALRVEILNPNMVPHERFQAFHTGRLFNGQPKLDYVVEHFPTEADENGFIDPAGDIVGNDDIAGAAKECNPYETISGNSVLSHSIGFLTRADGPSDASPGYPQQISTYDGFTFEIDNRFATFVRLQIGDTWYRISKHLNWHHTLRVKCEDGIWKNNFSKTGISDPTD